MEPVVKSLKVARVGSWEIAKLHHGGRNPFGLSSGIKIDVTSFNTARILLTTVFSRGCIGVIELAGFFKNRVQQGEVEMSRGATLRVSTLDEVAGLPVRRVGAL